MFHVSQSAVLAGLETTDGRNTFYWILPGHPGILRVKDEEQISSDNGRHCLFLWRGHFEVECIWQICLLWMHILPLLSEYTYKHPRIQCSHCVHVLKLNTPVHWLFVVDVVTGQSILDTLSVQLACCAELVMSTQTTDLVEIFSYKL